MDSYLAHHGVKGQKWGVRRFQNKDGSLTSAGKARYGANGDIFDIEASAPPSSKAVGKATQQGVKGASQTVQGAKKLSDIANEQPRNRYDQRKPLTQEEIDSMSNKELQELVTRMNLEQQYSALTADKVNQSKIDKGLRYTDAVLSIAGGVLTIALAYKQLKG